MVQHHRSNAGRQRHHVDLLSCCKKDLACGRWRGEGGITDAVAALPDAEDDHEWEPDSTLELDLVFLGLAREEREAGVADEVNEWDFNLGFGVEVSDEPLREFEVWTLNKFSTFVFANDTWFHFTTKTINLTQVHSLSTPLNTSIGLLPKCYNQPNPHDSGCTLNIGASANFILGGSESYKVMANLSSSIRINTLVRDNDTFAYIGKPPSPALEPIDYVSHSWALKTQCTPVTSQCIGTNLPGAFFKYNCPFAMQGIVSTDRNSAYQNQFVMNYFTNSTAMSNDTGRTNLGNPYFHATIAVVNQNLGHAAALTGDPEIAGTGHGADIFAFFCNTTVYDVEYASVNSTITKFETKLANSTLANIIQGTQQYTAIGDAALIQGAGIGDIVSSSVQGAADYYAMTYSQVALNVATVAFTPQTAIQAQRRETMLVAKVPIVPLACLLGANLALALLGIVLAVLAVVKSKGEVREVQARLSVSALVAALFEGRKSEGAVESVEGLFEERGGRGGPRVGLVKSAGGGWKYSVWRPT